MRERLPLHPSLLLILLVTLSACGARGPQRASVEITDDLGRNVQIQIPVGRIVTMAPNLTEIAFAAGAGDKIVGVTTADNYPPEVDSIPRFAAVGVDFEAVVALKPELILATDQVNSPRDAEMFNSLAIPIVYMRFGSLEDIFEAIKTVGDLAGTGTRAAEHSGTLADAIEDLRETTAGAAQRPRVLFLISSEKLFGFGKNSYIHEMIEIAGGASVSGDVDVEAPVFSEEYVIQQAPDVIIGAFENGTSASDLLESFPAWSTVPAIRNDRVYAINPDVVLRPGPRVVEGTFRMALLLHPALFESDASIVRR